MTFNSIGDTLKSWKKMPKIKGVPTVTLYDVAMGKNTSFIKWKVHNDWVTKVSERNGRTIKISGKDLALPL